MTNSNSRGEKLSELLAELKAEYKKSFPTKVQLLQSLWQSQDWPNLTEEFHKLKGTGRTYGYPEVSILCEALEIYCRRGTIRSKDLEAIFPIFERMQTAWNDGALFNLQQDPEAHLILALKEEVK